MSANEEDESLLEGEEKIRVMLETLKSSQLFVRVTGTEQLTLEGIENPELTFPIMLNELKNPDWWTVRFGVVEAIQEIALRGSTIDDKYVSELIQYLKDDDEDFRGKIADCLGDTKNKLAVKPLIEALNDKHDETRELAAKALGKIPDESSVPKLVEVIEQDTSSYVVKEALTSIGNLLEGKKSFAQIETITKKLSESEESIHRAAAIAIGKIGDPNGIIPLLKLLNPSRKDTTPEGREEMLESLKKFSELSIMKQFESYAKGDENILLDLIEEAMFHHSFEYLHEISEEKKQKLIPKYERQFRKVKTEIDGINGFVADIFAQLAKVDEKDELETLLDTVPRKRKNLERIDLEKIAKYKWVQHELFENLQEAKHWYNKGLGALSELENAIQSKIDNLPNV